MPGLRWAVLLAAVLLTARYVVAIVRSESGSTVAGEAWANAIYAAAGQEFIPVHKRFPAEQAEFWLARTDSLPDDPELLCGAALILDEPSPAYRLRMLKRREGPLMEHFRGLLPPVEFDDEAIDRTEEEFQEQTTERCLDLLRRATVLAPEDRDLWRTRALLLFRGFLAPGSWRPRTPEWLAVLDEAQRHDPDNALYDLIAAMHLLRESADIDFIPEVSQITVRNRLLLEDAVRRLERGLARPHLQTGASRSRCMWRFLSTVRRAGVDPLQLGVADEFDGRTMLLLRELVRWERAPAELAVIEERPEDAVRGLDLLRKLPRQMEAREGNGLGYVKLVPLFRQIIVANVEGARQQTPEADSKWDAEQFATELDGAKREVAGMDARAALMRQPSIHIQEIWPMVATVSASVALVLFVPCLVAGGVLLGLRPVLQRVNDTTSIAPLSIGRCLLFWLGGLALAAGLVWLATFLPASRAALSHAGALDDLIREAWGRSAFALIKFLRGPVGWNILAATLGLLLLSTVWRHSRSSGAGWSSTWTEPRRWSVTFVRDGARLALGTAVFLLVLHLVCLPAEVPAVDAMYRQWQAWGSDPQVRWAAWDATAAAVP